MNRQFIREYNALFLARLQHSWKRLTAIIGADEALLLIALSLLLAGLWPLAVRWLGTGLPTLVVPGVVLLFIALPSRAPMIIRPQVPDKSRKAN